MLPDQLGSTPQTAPLVNKSCRTLCHRQRLHKHHGHWELQRSNPSLLSPQSLRVQAGVSGFPTVHCNMSLHAVVAGVITPQRPFAPAGVFGYHPHPGSTQLTANAAAMAMSTPSKGATLGVNGCQGPPGQTLQDASNAQQSKTRMERREKFYHDICRTVKPHFDATSWRDRRRCTVM